ncbi:cytochrome P450 [Iamia sp. SCSIO 61187]|uniref:cytochrome P450 n=1 Tax=Iamia sp. SCSIO 61187 TaxID=2722752 RepID=UPI001C6347B9|nr:cytochrome P450 [Iamia sp. SCSIO 61187]QYG95060.1 cytochrome P450 [Iamia sp. SCSIO 61187]
MSVGSTTGLRLADPATFAAGVPHAAIDALRAESPVAWQDMPDDQSGFWAVLTHADVVTVAREPVLFSATRGGVVLEDLPEDSLEMMRGMLLAMDPPRHLTYRKPLADSFKAKVIAGMEDQIRALTRSVLADAAARSADGGEVDFVHDVAAHIPTQVMGRLMGLPEEDWALLHTLAERQTSGQDPDVVGEVDHSASIEMAMYAIGFAAERRTQAPREDLTTLILDGDFGGQTMSDVDFGSFFVQLVTAGNDTTQTMLSSGLLALLAHPEQLDALRADPSRVAGAVEEILRWANPLHYFRRTATEDTVLGGQAIAAGDKVAMYYTAANRDPAVFADPHAFDITRSPNPHLSFGIAEHFCLGVHLARLEGRIFFEELLAAFPSIEQTGDPVRLRSNLNSSYKRVPVRLS